MELIIFDSQNSTFVCKYCGAATCCPECDSELSFCPECGESVSNYKTFIVLTTDKYDGWDKMSSHTATLIIDDKDYASIHISADESDEGGDIAYLQLSFIPSEKQTEDIANIIVSFVKWARYDWRNPDKRSVYPTLVRLIGITIYKNGNVWSSEKWVALNDAMQIRPEHLERSFTSKEVIE
ncbi:hypothetical protein LJB89_03675 [Tyzzerella sp. OttesenSCG-928-J15]|nr:hypothetical protein [Tyzzerella sp. OttesenSCG-928-J15]